MLYTEKKSEQDRSKLKVYSLPKNKDLNRQLE